MDYPGDQSAAGEQSRSQRIPSGAQSQPQQKRNNYRNRKGQPQPDGTVSDGPVFQTGLSPHSRKAQHKQRASVATGVISEQQNNMGRMNAQKQRPVSTNAGHMLTTPPKEQAYAGPTFHASPAPSSLPMPKFFSKSLPNTAAQPSLQSRLAGEKTPEELTSSPEPDIVAPTPPRETQESPLEFFFQADRVEKEKARSGSNSLSPLSARRPTPTTTSRSPFQQSGKQIFLREMNGDDENMPSLRTVPTQSRPTLSERAYSSPAVAPQPSESDEEHQAKTKALKQLLFNTTATPPRSQSRGNSRSQTPEAFFGSPSPFQRASSGPSTPQPTSEQQNQYSLHYGNRNLSPLFKATRSETPARPSSLRQQVGNDSSANSIPPPITSFDPNALARFYLQEQIRTSGQAEMPKFGFREHPQPHGSGNTPGPVSVPVQPANAQEGASDPTGSSTPRSGASRDGQFRGMEDDLRRMLKIA